MALLCVILRTAPESVSGLLALLRSLLFKSSMRLFSLVVLAAVAPTAGAASARKTRCDECAQPLACQQRDLSESKTVRLPEKGWRSAWSSSKPSCPQRPVTGIIQCLHMGAVCGAPLLKRCAPAEGRCFGNVVDCTSPRRPEEVGRWAARTQSSLGVCGAFFCLSGLSRC